MSTNSFLSKARIILIGKKIPLSVIELASDPFIEVEEKIDGYVHSPSDNYFAYVRNEKMPELQRGN